MEPLVIFGSAALGIVLALTVARLGEQFEKFAENSEEF